MMGFQTRVGGDWPRFFSPSDLIGSSFGLWVASDSEQAEFAGLDRRCLLGTTSPVAVSPLG